MRCFKTGLVPSDNQNQLVLALEPETASLCVTNFGALVLGDGESTTTTIPVGSRYIVLDCGGNW